MDKYGMDGRILLTGNNASCDTIMNDIAILPNRTLKILQVSGFESEYYRVSDLQS